MLILSTKVTIKNDGKNEKNNYNRFMLYFMPIWLHKQSKKNNNTEELEKQLHLI